MAHLPARAQHGLAHQTQAAWTALMLTPGWVALAWLAMAQGWISQDGGLLALVGCIAWLSSAVQALPACTDTTAGHKRLAETRNSGVPGTRR